MNSPVSRLYSNFLSPNLHAWIGFSLVLLALFFGLAYRVFVLQNATWDIAAFQFLQNHPLPPVLMNLLQIVEHASDRETIKHIFVVNIGFALLIPRFRLVGLCLLLQILWSVLCDDPLKQFFYSIASSPIDPSMPIAYPSGHALFSMSYYGFLMYLIARHSWPIFRPIWAISTCLFILSMGLSVVVHRHHVLSDILGGYLLGAVLLLIGIGTHMLLLHWFSPEPEAWVPRKLLRD